MPRSFLEQQHALQLKILPRLQTLGIVAVLPAFAGFVPRALKYAYPNASITAGALWLHSAEYSGVDVLSANDPLFTSIGKAFIDGYATAYAVANYTLQHYYSADTFNENAPASSDPAFLKAYAAATHRAMVAGDTQAVWVCQAWAFGSGFWTNGILEAYLSGVSNSSMLLLDLVSDQVSRSETTRLIVRKFVLLLTRGARRVGRADASVGRAMGSAARPHAGTPERLPEQQVSELRRL